MSLSKAYVRLMMMMMSLNNVIKIDTIIRELQKHDRIVEISNLMSYLVLSGYKNLN